jgi:putative ABC transport system permease protein
MISKNLITFLRDMKKYPKLHIVNIAGLSVGILTFMFVFVFSAKELSTDRFHNGYGNIFRITYSHPSATSTLSSTFFPMGGLLRDNCPEIEYHTRLITNERVATVKSGRDELRKQSITYVDEGFFKIFNFPLLQGNAKDLFLSPDNIIISEHYAQLFFGKGNPIGQTVNISQPDKEMDYWYTVVGVLKKYPENATIAPDYIANIEKIAADHAHSWSLLSPQLYIKSYPGADINKLENKISDIVHHERNKIYKTPRMMFTLQPLTDIYLKSGNVSDKMPKGDITLLRVFLVLGGIILLICSLNYTILNLGFYLKKTAQLWIHNVLGANKMTMIRKFMHNAVFMSIISFVVCLLLYPFLYRTINSVWETRYHIFSPDDIMIWAVIFIFMVFIGAANGILQYFIVSRLRNKTNITQKRNIFPLLIKFQLIVFITVIVGLMGIHKQLNYIRNSDKGFDIENTYNLAFFDFGMLEQFRNEFEMYIPMS